MSDLESSKNTDLDKTQLPESAWVAAAPAYLQLMQDATLTMSGAKIRLHCLYHELFKCLSRTPMWHVLDLGCGEGWLCKWLLEQAELVYGIDISLDLLSVAANTWDSVLQPRAAFTLGDLSYALPFVDGYFDCIVANLVINWVENLDNIISELFRISATKSHVIITMPHPYFTTKAGTWDLSDPNDLKLILRDLRPRKVVTYIDSLTKTHEPIGPLVHYHRLISDYVLAFRKYDFTILEIRELFCSEEILVFDASYNRHVKIPLFVLFLLGKQ